MLLYPLALASGDRLLPKSVYVRDAADQRLLAAVQASVSTGVQWPTTTLDSPVWRGDRLAPRMGASARRKRHEIAAVPGAREGERPVGNEVPTPVANPRSAPYTVGTAGRLASGLMAGSSRSQPRSRSSSSSVRARPR